MPGTPTTNYNLIISTVGGDYGIWASNTNTNWTSVDGILKTNADAIAANTVTADEALATANATTIVADAALPRAGGTMTGTLAMTDVWPVITATAGTVVQGYLTNTAHSAELGIAATGEVTIGPIGAVWGKVIASTETEAATDDTLMTRKLGDERYIQDIPAVSQPVKAWAKVLGDGTVPRQTGVDTVVKNSTGNFTVTLTDVRSTADYAVQLTADCTTTTPLMIMIIPGTQTTNQFQVAVRTIGAAVADPVAFHITVIDG